MFGIFKKPNAEKSALECQIGWQSLSSNDKNEMARAIGAFIDLLSNECDDAESALIRTVEVKNMALRQYGVRDKRHPIFIQFQVVNDFIYSAAQGQKAHATCAGVLDKIISPLSAQRKNELRKKLEKFV